MTNLICKLSLNCESNIIKLSGLKKEDILVDYSSDVDDLPF